MQVTICAERSIILLYDPTDRCVCVVWSIRPLRASSSSSSSASLDLVRRTGDGGHLFRRVLALRQRSALRRVKLQPSVVAVHHHRAKSKELCKERKVSEALIERKREREKALA